MTASSVFQIVVGVLMVLFTLSDAFDTVILPRTVKRSFRLTTGFLFFAQMLFRGITRLPKGPFRVRLVTSFAPLMLFALLGIWAATMIIGFALVGLGLNTPFRDMAPPGLFDRLYFSGTTFFTLGFGDYAPGNHIGKVLAVFEGAFGFGFLALVIGYVPVFYTAFSSREQTILLLDSKAGSNPTAAQILKRHAEAGCLSELPLLLRDWEKFSAQLLENFLSYPVVALYRSQHDDQSWLNSLTAIMDVCSLIVSCCPAEDDLSRRMRFQAENTFMMARHLVVDFAYIMAAAPEKPPERLTDVQFVEMAKMLNDSGLHLNFTQEAFNRLKHKRTLYEPFVQGLADRLLMDLPDWVREQSIRENWETSAWDGTHF